MGEPAAVLTRVLQLASPALPIGAYAYSEGLERAVESGLVDSPDEASAWVEGLLEETVARLDVPLFGRLYRAWESGRPVDAQRLSARLLAHRETAELRAADRHLGQALARVTCSLGIEAAAPWRRGAHATYAAMLALACQRLRVPLVDGAHVLAWTWAENLVAAAVKLIPLGQTDGQRILFRVGGLIPAACELGLALDDESIGGSAMGQVIASARHEHQHTRLFRS